MSNTVEGADHGHILGQPAANPATATTAPTKQQTDTAHAEDGSSRADRATQRCAGLASSAVQSPLGIGGKNCMTGSVWQATMGGQHVPHGDATSSGGIAQLGKRLRHPNQIPEVLLSKCD